MQTTTNTKTALIEIVGVLLRANTEGGLWQALANEGITDAYMQSMTEALKALGPDGIATMEHRYEIKVSEDMLAELGVNTQVQTAGNAEFDPQYSELVDAFRKLPADVESIACGENAYGFPVEGEDHPDHESVLRARAALAQHPVTGNPAGPMAAKRFMQELLDSVETLSGIAEEHGPRTLADLMYLQQAILSDSFIDHHPGESKVLDITRSLPSGEQWGKFIKIYVTSELGSSASTEAVIAEVVGVLEGHPEARIGNKVVHLALMRLKALLPASRTSADQINT